MYPVVEDGPGATVEATAAFLAAYAAARGSAWTVLEAQAAWAAGLWVLSHNADIDGIDGPATRHLLSELDDRCTRAAVSAPRPGERGPSGPKAESAEEPTCGG